MAHMQGAIGVRGAVVEGELRSGVVAAQLFV